jgi:hypothetical protein
LTIFFCMATSSPPPLSESEEMSTATIDPSSPSSYSSNVFTATGRNSESQRTFSGSYCQSRAEVLSRQPDHRHRHRRRHLCIVSISFIAASAFFLVVVPE